MAASVELAPGMMTALFARLGLEAHAAVAEAMLPLALAVERQAKINASSGEHALRTKTPASRGSGPARISGTLVRSITHSEVTPSVGGWEVKVGTAGGLFPYYNRHTPSSKYGYYLETGLRNGAKYPWLAPAVHMVGEISIYAIFAAAFAKLSI
jgi:hypothetical protein